MPKTPHKDVDDDEETEGGFRGVFPDLKMPREILGSLFDFADKSKNDLSAIVGQELKNLLKKVDARELLLKLLSQGTIEIDAKIRIVPSKGHDNEEKEVKKARKSRRKPPKT